jgi:hypothetical protein
MGIFNGFPPPALTFLKPKRRPVWAGLTQMWEPGTACERGRN